MHVVVSKKELQRILQRCQGVADKRSTLPAVGNVLLETDGDQLRLAATDLYLAVSGSVPAQVEVPGSIAVGARDLFERVKMMPEGGQIAIETTEGSATTIRAIGSARRYTLHGIPGDDFPSLPTPDEGQPTLSLPAAALAKLINKTHFSISADETRSHLNSALFEWSGETVRMVTTDGHRLSKMEARVPGNEANSTMLIPLKGVMELKRLCDEAFATPPGEEGKAAEAAMIEMSQKGPDAFFRVAGFRFSVKLVDAQFPPYQQVIPDATERTIRAPNASMADALKAVRVAASDRTGGVKLTVGGGNMRFESESPESGAGFDEVPIEYDGEEITVGFNASYFLEVLNAIEQEEVLLGISGELDPAVVRPADEPEGDGYVAVVMPMRI